MNFSIRLFHSVRFASLGIITSIAPAFAADGPAMPLAVHGETVTDVDLARWSRSLGPQNRRGTDPKGRAARQYAAPSDRHAMRSPACPNSLHI